MMYKFHPKNAILFYAKTLSVAIGLVLTVLLGGCAMKQCLGDSPAQDAANRNLRPSSLLEPEKSRYEYVQKQINTSEDVLFHDAVVEYGSYETPYSFYLLGFEKPRDKHAVIKPYCRPTDLSCHAPKFDPTHFRGGPSDNPEEIADTQDEIEENLFDNEHHLVLTHVLNVRRTTANVPIYNQKECFIFNVYGEKSATPWCKHYYKADIDKPDWKREGWKGLDQLAADIKERVAHEKATHIILLTNGWNAGQYESYLAFCAWMKALSKDFKVRNEDFRPIFIGSAWGSESPVWEKFPLLSEFTQGNDADEIGFAWQNYIINDLLKPIAQTSGAQLIAIGHSFGSRIALGSHYVRDILVRNHPVTDTPLTIIGIQAAFPVTRFIADDGREHPYIAANKGNAHVVITSSINDELVGKMCHATIYVGDGCGLKELKTDQLFKDSVVVLTTQSTGDLMSTPDSQRVSVYDVSPFVNCELMGTSSGAHSDVYDEEMGHFLGEVIRSSAKANQYTQL